MPTPQEWFDGRTADGTELDPKKCQRYRRRLRSHPDAPRPTIVPRTIVHTTSAASARAKKPCRRPQGGPGTELKQLLTELGIPAKWCEGCTKRAATMDGWGIDGCREKRAVIVGWLQEQRDAATWTTQATVAAKMVTTGVYLMVNPLDPLGSLLDIAIHRAESKLTAASGCDA